MKQFHYRLIFVIFVLLELGALTVFNSRLNAVAAPLIWLIAGAFTVYAGGQVFYRYTPPLPHSNRAVVAAPYYYYVPIILLFLTAMASIYFKLDHIFEKYPITIEQSDIIPAISFYVKRLLAGETVYTTIDFGTYQLYPNYFPTMWLPFVPAELYQFDYRWIGFGAFAGASYLYLWRVIRQRVPFLEKVIKAILPSLLLYPFLVWRPEMFGHSVELLIIGFYLLLSLGIARQHFWMIAIATVLCLLSRYALLVWLPAALVIYYFENNIKKTTRLALTIIAGILLFFGPFLLEDPAIPQKGMTEYREMINARWTTKQPWENPVSPPYLVDNNYGLAHLFYKFLPGTAEEKLAVLSRTHLAGAIFMMLLTVAGYFWMRGKVRVEYYLLLSLKAYLLVFYAFIQAPYPYLFLLPFFLSLPLLFEIQWFNPRVSNEPEIAKPEQIPFESPLQILQKPA